MTQTLKVSLPEFFATNGIAPDQSEAWTEAQLEASYCRMMDLREDCGYLRETGMVKTVWANMPPYGRLSALEQYQDAADRMGQERASLASVGLVWGVMS